MTSPKTPQQLADAIETVVASYLDEVRRTVQHAVERSLSRAAATARPSESKVDRSTEQRSTKKRRSAGALDELCDKLHQCVCARPGESSAVLADEIGCTVRDLQRPMAKLKAQGRIRCAGQRNLMRYFPAVTRASKSIG
jgi:CRP-like cAMP-binding protein